MTDEIELLYDRVVAAEKLKSGTKYERLAAIVFRILSADDTVHDLRLRGETGVPHQIDAVVGDERKRVLVEAKDYDRVIDLPIVRNFWAVVEDLKPDDAFIVSTEGFSPNAQQYAAAKQIRLAVLRPPKDEDWQGLIRRVTIDLVMTAQVDSPRVVWKIHPDDHHKISGSGAQLGLTETRKLELADSDGHRKSFFDLLDKQLREDYGAVPLGATKTIGRLNQLTEPTWLHAPGVPPLRVTAWKWGVAIASSTQQIVVDEGVGRLTAELVLRTVDGSIHQMFTRGELQAWTFDGKDVVARA